MMDRLQKKCFVASAGVHLLLALILLVGPAFLSSKSQSDNLPVLDFIPYKTVDALVSGGGSPNAQPPPAPPQPQAPQPPAVPPPQPQPPAVRQPEPLKLPEVEPPKEPARDVKPIKPESDSLEPANPKKPRKPEVSTTVVKRSAHDAQAEANARAEANAKKEARQYAEAQRRLAESLGKAAERLGDERSSGTTIELKGPGGGGVPYANFLQAVKSRYANAWVVPDGVTDDEATAAASVTIARDGTVISARIVRSSGNTAVDRSVQATLDRVRFAAPLPDEAKEDHRTVTINFNVKAKRGLG
jgi:colicin import membrane protein